MLRFSFKMSMSSMKGLRNLRYLFLLLGLAIYSLVRSQPNTYIRIDNKDKPKKYETKILPVEKSSDIAVESGKGELHGFKKFIQGTYTHFNFLFNANNKLNQALQNAQNQNIDDFTKLLPFDNYDLSALSQNYYLDTAIEKANGSLVLHDIRNEWNDEVYLILGKSFYYKMLWDSAAIYFQYLNYAFAPKDDGYDIPIGSNVSHSNHELSIVSDKAKGLFKHNPRRNEGLIWLAKSLIMSGDVSTGKGILDLLYEDAHLPKKLLSALNDCNARAFYFRKQYDSAAFYMDASFDVASSNLDKSRRKYLAAQLWKISNHPENAKKDFEYAASHSPNILMEIYAILQLSDMDSSEIGYKNQLERLNTLSKKGKYKEYQDLIFYLMGQQYLQANDSSNAIKYYTLSTQTNISNNKEWKYRSFQKIGDIAENRFEFNQLVKNYDSIKSSFGQPSENALFQTRKQAIHELGTKLKKINEQDSLLQLAALPPERQDKILKEQVKKIRKLLGLKDQESNYSNPLSSNSNATTDLFSGLANKSGQWYFNNNDIKAQGYQSFIVKFGNRPNVDNWIRQSAIQSLHSIQNNEQTLVNNLPSIDSSRINVAYLKSQLPNTPEKRQEALQTIAENQLQSGKIMEVSLYNFPAAIWFYKQAASNEANTAKLKEELLYHLSTSYFENGDKKASNAIRAVLLKEYPNSPYLTNENNQKKTSISSEETAPGKTYANIYNEMISGAFEKAKSDKLKADSIYGSQYWTPQLLFIESIYYVSERKDSVAIDKLKTLEEKFPQSVMKPQAEDMIRILSHRKEIEDYLTKLQITKLEDEEEVFQRKGIDNQYDAKIESKGPIQWKDSITSSISKITALNLPKLNSVKTDTASKNGIPPYIISVDSPHYVVVLLDKVAKVFATETGNAFNRFNRQYYHSQNLPLRMQILDERYQMALIGPFKDAGDAYIYIDKVEPITSNRILPWLGKDKYRFSMISDRNLEILLQYKNLVEYQEKLHQTLPGKF